ncbi:DMT family transporter [Bacillus sp. V33-4]|uniref:DMT family transporter n=1 Tax=Bacillus sp. V33-4 TaxID=2054169 RepID=UPI000C780943|nr:EamA family transporter [Bacillus sp. V33-4]PLR87276.1 EamA family transporter [Bacillus sp. V33-4]
MGKLYGALFVLSLIWGTSFLFIKILLENLAPSAVVFGRCLFGAAALALIIFFQKKEFLVKGAPWRKLLLVGFLNNALPWYFISVSETQISSSLASVINASTPIWTLIIGAVLFSARLKGRQWIGILIGFAGIIILSDIRPGDFVSGNLFGIGFMSAAAACYGAGAHLTKKYLVDLPIIHISFYTLLAATMISFVAMLATAPDSLPQLVQSENLLPLLGLGSFGSGIAYLFYFYLVKEGSAELASLVTYIVPGTALIWGAVLLDESIHLSMIFGLLVIFSGVYISTGKKTGKKGKPAAA